MRELVKYVLENVYNNKIEMETGANIIKIAKEASLNEKCDIAVIGIGTMLPSSANIEEFWENVRNGVICNRKLPGKRKEDMDAYHKYIGQEEKTYLECSYIDEIDEFDYDFFRLSPNEAKAMDPYQRMFLQTAWKAIEDAGYGGERIYGSNTGVFVGYAPNANDCYYRMLAEVSDEMNPNDLIGNISAIIPSRISYLLDLHGPSMLIDTACSSSMVAVHQACLYLKNRECDMAIAGGIKVNLVPIDLIGSPIGISSTDGLTRSFDNNSDGAGRGEGIIALLLKPLKQAQKDGDNIHAMIKGSAINQDGSSMGLTAPNPEAQTEVILNAWKAAELDPHKLSYIEVHGTGTRLGDTLEIEALNKAFSRFTDKKQLCPIGTVKSIYGHLYECSGLAGILNAIMALKHREIPACCNFTVPNSNIDFCSSSLYVNTKPQKYEKDEPMCCGVSSFGLSGTNCHMVLEEAPAPLTPEAEQAMEPQLLCLSAKSENGLRRILTDYKEFLETNKELVCLPDLCFTANAGRGHYTHRMAILTGSAQELYASICSLLEEDEWINRARVLYGVHKVVSVNRERLAENAITEARKAELTRQADQILAALTESGGEFRRLFELAGLYVAGAAVDFLSLYEGQGRHSISLPTYPFEKKRCWFDLPEQEEDKVQNGSQAEDQELFYHLRWVQAPLSRKVGPQKRGRTVLFSRKKDGDLYELLKQNWLKQDEQEQNVQEQDVQELDAPKQDEQVKEGLMQDRQEFILVSPGEAYEKISNQEYRISGEREDYERLVADLLRQGVSRIVYDAGLDSMTDARKLEELLTCQKWGFYGLLRLVKAILALEPEEEIDITLLTRGAYEVTGEEEVIIPEQAMIHGLGKVVNKETKKIRCHSIDVDSLTPPAAFLVELWTNKAEYELAAYRQGIRYVEEFAGIEEEELGSLPLKVQEGNVYVITGGLGGIGLEIGKYLAGRNRIRLALIGRSPMPELQEGSLTEAGFDEKSKNRLAAIREITGTGSEVDYYRADVTSLEEMTEVIGRIRSRYGGINGVIHCAGIATDRPLMEKEEEDFAAVIGPKVQGTWILNKLTEEDNLDFFMMSSSVATIFSMQGQGDYVAANAYLDSFAQYRSRQGKRTLTVNWTTWKETGMAYNSGFVVDTIFKTLPSALGIEGLDRLLSSSRTRALVGRINYEGIGLLLLEKSGIRLGKDIEDKIGWYREQSEARKGRKKKKETGGALLTGRDNGKYNEVEKVLADICRKTLGFEEIDIYDNFFEMGADSIILMKIQAEIEKALPVKLSSADMFEYTTVAKLAEYIIGLDEGLGKKSERKEEYEEPNGEPPKARAGKDIAIIGMALNFPMADNSEQFWENIRSGLDCVGEPPRERKEDVLNYARFRRVSPNDLEFNEGGYIKGADKFDYSFFRIPPREAKLIDPNHRVFLETAWKAIEDAGYGGKRIVGSNTGVYLGFASTQMYHLWFVNEMQPSAFSAALVGNTAAVAAGRLSYLLDLKGPSMLVDTACSSSLVAVHTACKAIQAGECDMAIAGGVRLCLTPVHQKGAPTGIGMDSSDGRARTFDFHSDGTGSGEGVAAVLLKPLEQAIRDGDNIYAVVKGSATNQDGSSAGITAPNPAAQEEVILKAWRDAGIKPETIQYIETHGTGTPLGDPIEIQGIRNAFEHSTDRKQFCAVSSVKTNIAHLSEAAGIAGLINAVMALKKKEIPPSNFFYRPNRNIDFDNSPVYVNTIPRKWVTEGHPRRCGISAFGMSGTNCHVVLEEYVPEAGVIERKEVVPDSGETGRHEYQPASAVIGNRSDRSEADETGRREKTQILTLSAKSEEALKMLIQKYSDYFKSLESVSLSYICYTANTGREEHNYRIALLAESAEEMGRRIDLLKQKGLISVPEEGIYYGTHKIVPESKEEQQENEITENQRRELSRQAAELLEKAEEGLENLSEISVVEAGMLPKLTEEGTGKYLPGTSEAGSEKIPDRSDDKSEKLLLEELCKLYVKGATIDWEILYGVEDRKKVSLPTYPFEGKRCWIDVPEYVETETDHYSGSRYHRIEWLEAGLDEAAESRPKGLTLVLRGKGALSDAVAAKLREAGRTVEVEMGDSFCKDREDHYIIEGTAEDYVRLFTELKTLKPQQIVHMLTLGCPEEVNTYEQLEELQLRGVYSLLRITKALAQVGIRHNIDMVLIAEKADRINEEERINPWNAPLFGLGKAIRIESPNQECRSLDVDEETTVDLIIKELMKKAGDAQVAYRKGRRYVSEFREYDPDYAPDRKIEVKDGNVYLITGGTGGMGIEMSLYLAGKAAVKIALIGRADLPERSEWKDILRYSRDKKTIQKIKDIQRIEALGSEVEYYRADVSDYGRMQEVVKTIREKHGKLNGIIHAAGLGGGGFLFQKEEADFNKVMKPKVYGTWILDRLTREEGLDFFVSCSSIATIFPGMGQGDYAAGNACLDSYAAYGSLLGRRTVTFNWVAWRDTGMAIEYGVNVDDTFKALPTVKAMKAFDEVLNKDLYRLVVGELNYGSDQLAALEGVPQRLSKKISSAVRQTVERVRRLLEEKKKALDVEVKLKGRDSQGYSEVESKLAAIYSHVLGFGELDIYDNFFELGGDSILLSRVYELVEAQFPGKVKLLDLFEYTTIAKLAGAIMGSEEETAEEEAAADSEDRLLEDELIKMFDKVKEGDLSVEEMLESISDL